MNLVLQARRLRRRREIVRRRLCRGQTYRRIAKAMHLSYSRPHQIVSEAMANLRNHGMRI